MSRTVRVIAICVVMVLLAGAVTGVAFLSANYKAPPAKTGLMVEGKLMEDPGVMVTVGEYEIPFDYYRYYYLTYKDTYDMYYGDTTWDTDFDHSKANMLKEMTESAIQRAYALQILAQEENITLTDEELASIEDEITAQKEVFGDDFDDRLRQMHYTSEDMYRDIAQQQMLQKKAQTEYTERLTAEMGDDIIADAQDGYATAKHILIGPIEQPVNEDLSAADTGEDTSVSVPADGEEADPDAEVEDPAMAAAYARAEELLAEIRSSSDPAATFDELMNEYSEDPGLATSPDGYTFGPGEMVDEFYDGTMALEVGEISDPIKSSYGYHIIMRVPLDEEYVDEYFETNRDSIISSAVYEKFQERLEKITANLPATPGEYYSYVSPTAIV